LLLARKSEWIRATRKQATNIFAMAWSLMARAAS